MRVQNAENRFLEELMSMLRVKNMERSKKGEETVEADQAVCLGILIIVSAVDIKCRKIPVEILALMNAGAIIFQCLCHREDVALIAGGMVIGIVFLAVSRITKEGVGYADSLGILGMGIYLGLWKLFEVLAGAFFLLAFCAMVVLARKKMSRKIALPFYPFLTAGYIFWLAGEIGI